MLVSREETNTQTYTHTHTNTHTYTPITSENELGWSTYKVFYALFNLILCQRPGPS